jgi:hypothetical protein
MPRQSSILPAAGDVPAAIEEKIMSEPRERMSNAMCLRGMAARTQEAYIAALIELVLTRAAIRPFRWRRNEATGFAAQ